MQLPAESELLRIFIGEEDRIHGKPLYEAIVEEARKQGMAGVTVTRGMMSYGASSRVHSAKILRLSDELPLVIELVDTHEKIAAFLPVIDPMITGGGLVTLEPIRVMVYRHDSQLPVA